MESNALTLYELNHHIKNVLHNNLPDMVWVQGETSDVRVNQNGHCYLEFIEKDKSGRNIIAKARAMIWANTFHLLRAYFESTTNQSFASGLKVMVQVSIEFHEIYGLSLTIYDIDPAYTLGDQALNRARILKQLEEEGVLTLNKELELSPLPNRIAIISSPTAAGYEDFCNQLEANTYQFAFYTKLFSAIMQGERAEDSIISALERIYEYQDCFDAVVIIRGGGATSELSCFDSYLLAASCAQFPLPIITGIGHERDETVLDIVAHTRAKTPTAVAEFLIGRLSNTSNEIIDIQAQIISSAREKMQNETEKLKSIENDFSFWGKSWYKDQSNILSSLKITLKKEIQSYLKDNENIFKTLEYSINKEIGQIIKNEHYNLNSYVNILKKASSKKQIDTDTIAQLNDSLKKIVLRKLDNKKEKIEFYTKYIELISPQHILKKGYTLTLSQGKVVKSASELSEGDILTTRFVDGEIDSVIKND